MKSTIHSIPHHFLLHTQLHQAPIDISRLYLHIHIPCLNGLLRGGPFLQVSRAIQTYMIHRCRVLIIMSGTCPLTPIVIFTTIHLLVHSTFSINNKKLSFKHATRESLLRALSHPTKPNASGRGTKTLTVNEIDSAQSLRPLRRLPTPFGRRSTILVVSALPNYY